MSTNPTPHIPIAAQDVGIEDAANKESKNGGEENPSQQIGQVPPDTDSEDSHISTSYWDSLEVISLTAPALREFNRRNRFIDQHVQEQTGHPNTVQEWSDVCRFSRHGGPNIQDIRGWGHSSWSGLALHSQRSMISTSTLSQDPSNRRSTFSGPYDHNYTEILKRHGIFITHPMISWVERSGANSDELKALAEGAITQEEQTTISDEVRENLEVQLDDGQIHLLAFDKADSILDMKTFVLNTTTHPDYYPTEITYYPVESGWQNIRSWSTDGTVKAAFYDDYTGLWNSYIGATRGSLPEELITKFSDLIEPTIGSSTILPNFIIGIMSFGEWLEPVIRRSVAVAAAMAARAFLEIRKWIEPEIALDQKASVIACTLLDGKMTFYSMHVEERGGREEYHMNYIACAKLWESVEGLAVAWRMYLIYLLWAREQRETLIQKMRTKAGAISSSSESDTNSSTPPTSVSII